MSTNLENLLSKKGQFCQVTYAKDVKQLKGHERNISKITSLNCRAGIEYDNLKDVKVKRSTGELPEENQGLPWGKWKKYPYLIEHNGSDYVRLTINKNNIPQSKFFLDGVEISKEEALKYAASSEKKTGDVPDVITIKLDNILTIT